METLLEEHSERQARLEESVHRIEHMLAALVRYCHHVWCRRGMPRRVLHDAAGGRGG